MGEDERRWEKMGEDGRRIKLFLESMSWFLEGTRSWKKDPDVS
jgi:hypothetical protein